jgi:exo-1,4-beta-D-glucosaminidase
LLQACEPLHIMYAYDDARAYAVNSLFTPVPGPLWGEAELFTGDGVVFANASGALAEGLAPDGVTAVFALPTQAEVAALIGPRRTYFVALRLRQGAPGNTTGPVVAQSTYWLSTQEDVLDWAQSTYITTPCSTYADYSDLLALPPAPLRLDALSPDVNTTIVTVTNTALDAVAFLVHLRLIGTPDGPRKGMSRATQAIEQDVWPVLWSDNYFTLQPGETRSVRAQYDGSAWAGQPAVDVESFNSVVSATVPPKM